MGKDTGAQGKSVQKHYQAEKISVKHANESQGQQNCEALCCWGEKVIYREFSFMILFLLFDQWTN